MNRRETLLTLFALGAATGSFVADAQQPEKVRRVGMLMGYAENDPEAQSRLVAFKKSLATLGWAEGGNLSIDVRWTAGMSIARLNLQKNWWRCGRRSRAKYHARNRRSPARDATIPIVFTVVSNPVGSGFVKTLSRPGGNITGFINMNLR